MAENNLSECEREEVERAKRFIDNMSDIRQVEEVYDYCFEVLNEFKSKIGQ